MSPPSILLEGRDFRKRRNDSIIDEDQMPAIQKSTTKLEDEQL
jgi:hypothetical protein